MEELLKSYLSQLQKVAIHDDAREESFYPVFESFIKELAIFKKIKNIDVTTLPKKTEAGNPDFRIWDGNNHITGYIEAKDPSVTNLDYIEGTEQLERYLSTFPNVILTNFYEFRLYRNGERIAQAMIGRPVIAKKLKTPPPLENIEKFEKLIDLFFSFSLPKVETAYSLAVELAKRTRFLRDEVIAVEMEETESKGHKQIKGFYEAFKKYLIATLTEKQFADLYAQTITYGLFAARTRADSEFNRKLAFDYIPPTIGILREVFHFISLGEPPASLQIIVDDIAEILNVADVNKILHEYRRTGKGRDPIIHFYETFLATYDPEIRERRGVYYTPEPVVGYIVRSIHSILKSHFDLPDGLASEEVKLLDPAGGTLTFPAESIRLAAEEYKSKYGEGGLHQWIKNHILKNFYAFELMMAPYAIGHLKIGFILDEFGYKLAEDERFKLYLTNTLELEDIEQISIPGLSSLSEESHLASDVKKNQTVLVILGNPPYSGISANPSETIKSIKKGQNYVAGYSWDHKKDKISKHLKRARKDIVKSQKTFIGDLLMDYYFVDGEPLGEKNPKWLQDDYIKFLRFAQWKIKESGFGVVGMITNHSYLDNPTFRGMRQSLMKTFDEIYILDLHGNSLKKETTPEGGKDENVFDIQQGVAIALFIRNKEPKESQVYHSDLYGLRHKKYNWLNNNEFKKENYIKIEPQRPFYFFKKRDTEAIKYYLNWKQITEIFPLNSVGIVTARDKLTIQWSSHDMWNTVLNFSKLESEFARQTYNLGKDVRDWKVISAQNDLKKSGPDKDKICPILYRPFDIRYTYYTGKSRGFLCMPRPEVMRHMMEENIGLTVGRQGQVVGMEHLWNLVFVSQKLIDFNLFYRGGAMLFPLYRYLNKSMDGMLSQLYTEKEPNISHEIFEKLEKTFKQKPTPEEILYYIYGIFYSNIYRTIYAEFLKIDFPRVPFTADFDLFKQMAALGKELADLHLLKSPALDPPFAKYQGTGTNDSIEKIKYDEKQQRIYINQEKYFENVPPEAWNYYIGGYQVLAKYLKDRKGRIMDDAPRYCRIVTAIIKTIEIQKKIDEIYPEIESELIEF